MISGSELPPGRTALQFARAYGGREVATVVASNFACGPIEAALTNGVLAHADETDDSHAPSQSHPGCAVIPAALAAGERFGIGGERFLRAVALGYDIGPRFTVTLGGQRFEAESPLEHPQHFSSFWRGRRRQLRREPERSADAMDDRLHRASILRSRGMEPRH